MRLLRISAIVTLALQATGAIIGGNQQPLKLIEHPDPATRELLQNIVTWDNSSLFVHGERIMIFSGEFHPFRLPAPSLWLDIFQKIKALGFNTVSFYVNWALLEGTPGKYTAEGIFALEPFFEAAKDAGIYLIARPGPYINAEVSGGGFPGWIQRVKGKLRSSARDFLNATDNYVANVARTVANAQITNGGPIILYQPENEYTHFCCGVNGPDGDYVQYVIDQARNAGVVIPIISNDASPYGTNAPGTGPGAVDIYGHDGYPLGAGCDQIKAWPSFPTDYRTLHLAQSPSTPYSLLEYQAGYFDPWGGASFDKCVAQLNEEYERVYYKNLYSFGVTILNLYMIYGGTNWGNLGDPYGYTSYDYGAAISENRQITREKYSELKLQAQFLKVSPTYLTAVPSTLSTGIYTDTVDLTVTPVIGNGSFFVVRHSSATGFDSTIYKLKVPTNSGQVVLPQLGGSLTLNSRDSKIHVTDYDVAGTNIQYSTAEILTWKKFEGSTVLVVYGGSGETHEISIGINGKASFVEGPRADVKIQTVGQSVIINWKTSPQRRIIRVADFDVLILDRNSAYNYWVPELSPFGSGPGFSSNFTTENSLIVKAGYLVRGAVFEGNRLYLYADFNATTAIEVIGAPRNVSLLYINGEFVSHQIDVYTGFWTASVSYSPPQINLPSLVDLEWKYVNSLPEIHSGYDDSAWTVADHKTTNNSDHPLKTPTSLYSSDYGYHAGYHIYRGHFVAAGNETSLTLYTQQGRAYGQSIWLNETYIGSWTGVNLDDISNATYQLPKLTAGKSYVFTILLDHMGLEENWVVGQDLMKTPRGILNYTLSNRLQSAITWKLTGNLGGEDYVDHVRGPLNEGGLYVERQGWHQPNPPSKKWQTGKGLSDGIPKPGVRFFVASCDLNLPEGWDVPLFFSFNNGTLANQSYRVQLYVNGYQFGKYSSNIGPQATFPVPEGILNYHGTNWLALSLWALEEDGAHIDGFALEHETPIKTSMRSVKLVNAPAYKPRPQSY